MTKIGGFLAAVMNVQLSLALNWTFPEILTEEHEVMIVQQMKHWSVL